MENAKAVIDFPREFQSATSQEMSGVQRQWGQFIRSKG
jgi:hypothetical protein